MVKQVTAGLIVPIEVKPEHTSEFEPFSTSAVDFIKNEPDTVHWFVFKQDDSNIYAFLDTFTTPAARDAHIAGAMKREGGLGTKGAWFSIPPQPMKVDIVAAKAATPIEGPKAGVTIGLHVTLKAKADKIDAVKEFLQSSQALVEAEPKTTHWVAIHHPGTNMFEIVDSFPDEEGRQAHLNGKVAEAVFANVATLLEEAPKVDKLTVLAGNLNA